jgi:hypothetical protein
MLLANPWKSFFRSTDGKLRIKRNGIDAYGAHAAEILEQRALLSNVNVAVSAAGAVSLQSTDAADHTVVIARSGGNILITGSNGTNVTFNGNTSTQQSIALANVSSLAIKTAAGVHDSFTVQDLNVSGAVSLTGATSGTADLEVLAENSAVTIGSINAKFNKENANFTLNADGVGLTVNGPVAVHVAGTATLNAELEATLNESNVAGALHVGSTVAINSTATGAASLDVRGEGAGTSVQIDGGLTGKLGNGTDSFTIRGDAGGTTHINGAVNLTGKNLTDTFDVEGGVRIGGAATFHSGAANDTVTIHGTAGVIAPEFDSSLKLILGGGVNTVDIDSLGAPGPITVNGALSIAATGSLNAKIRDALLHSSLTVKAGASAASTLNIDGTEVDGATNATIKGAGSVVNAATDSGDSNPTHFKGKVTLHMSGASAVVNLSNSNLGTPLIFDTNVTLIGGTPVGTLHLLGAASINTSLEKLVRFNLV